MRTSNPILGRADSFTPAHATPYDGTSAVPQGQEVVVNQFGQSYMVPNRMTIDDVLTKSSILLLVVAAFAAASWVLLPPRLLWPVALIGTLVVFVTSLIVATRHQVSKVGIGIYAVVEGIVIGAWSAMFNLLYPGIVAQAIIATMFTAAVVFGAYKYLNVRIQGRFAKIITYGVLAYALFAFVSLILMLFGVHTGAFLIGSNAGPFAWILSAIAVFLASASLVQDFQAIENGVNIGAPEEESWRAAFGLLVTLVWLYTEILRVMSYFRN